MSAKPKEEPTPTPLPTPIVAAKPTYQVQRGEVIKKIEFSGRIAPVSEQQLFFRISGRVHKIYAKKGDTVAEGQLLADLEAGPSEFDLRRAQVNLEIAQLNLELTRRQIPASSEVYTTTVAIREREVALAQIALDELNTAIADTRIVAPMNGTVLLVAIAEGSSAEAYKSAIVLADLDNLEVSADLSLEQLEQVSTGMSVTVAPVGRPGDTAEGTIRSLPYPYGGEGATGEDSRTTRVSLAAQPIELGYKMGDLVRLTLILDRKENTLWLPPQAIRNFEGRRFVIVLEGDAQRRVDVKVGVEGEERVEILEGLEEGQIVVSP